MDVGFMQPNLHYWLSKIISEKEDDLVTNEWTAVKMWEDAAVQIWRERRSWVRRAGEK